MRIALAFFTACLLFQAPATASDAPSERWVVLPAQAESPPPRDPTLLRLSREVGEAIHEAVQREVVVVSRELREDACPSLEGRCPRDIAAMLKAEHAVSLVLKPDFTALELRVYGAGLEHEGSVPCTWKEGLVTCQTDRIAKVLDLAPATKSSPGKKGSRPSALEQAQVDRAFAKLSPKLKKCARKGWGEATERPASITVQFRVTEHGKVTEVRISPLGLDDAPAFSCMARLVESLWFSTGPVTPEPFRFPVPRPD